MDERREQSESGLKRIAELIGEHESWRAGCLNMIASENRISPGVKRYLSCDLVQRYGDYAGRSFSGRKYQGTRYVEEVEAFVGELAKQIYRVEYAELRAISGHLAGAAVIMALTRPGDVICEVSRDIGCHREAYKLGQTSAMPLDVRFLPSDPQNYNIDLPGTLKMIEELQPRMVILGSSNFLFPHPVREIAGLVKDMPETILVYDASHVFGLIAGGQFQYPIQEGADIVFGSTHKTLPGPQGGLILSNRLDYMEKIAGALYPALVTNHHLARLPALGVALLEMMAFGREYARQVVQNANALGAAIAQCGVKVVSKDGRYSQSHTILVLTGPDATGQQTADDLEAVNIIVTAAHIPVELGGEGIRLGVQELTRLGALEADMDAIAALICQTMQQSRAREKILRDVLELAGKFTVVKYCFNGSGETKS